MTFDDLLTEYRSPERIGEAIWSVLVEVARNVCRKYPASVYADDARWTPEAVEDLAQDVALGRLLGEGQLDYVFTIAAEDPARGLHSIKGLIGHQVKRVLDARRPKTVVDRLVKRTRELLEDEELGVEGIAVGSDVWLRGHGVGRRPSELTSSERRRGGHAIAGVPRIPSNPNGQRESKVYAKPQLIEVVVGLVEEFDGIYLGDVRRILEDVLTAWLPEILYDSEGVEAVAHAQLDDLEMSHMSEQAAATVERLSDEQLFVMIGKANGVSDSVLGRELGCSRPTVIKHKRAFEETVDSRLLTGIDMDRRNVAIEVLLEHALLRLGEGRHGSA